MKRIAAACLLVAVLDCKPESRQLTEDLGVMQDRKLELVRQLDAHADAVRSSERRLDELRREVTANAADAQSFLAGHRISAACIRASRQTWGIDENVFANDTVAYPQATALVCNAFLLDKGFKSEIDSVVARLRQSRARAKELDSQIAELQRVIENQRAQVESDERAVDQLSVEMSRVHRRMND